ncbi:MAG TPA: hypothetical protein VJ771_05715 [Candidatus Nitrosotalea sp.]|nr:hypothetical protein [Candidatus Nitrosotalea sp.]
MSEWPHDRVTVSKSPIIFTFLQINKRTTFVAERKIFPEVDTKLFSISTMFFASCAESLHSELSAKGIATMLRL